LILKHIRVIANELKTSKPLLEDINLEIRMGEWLSVIGRNGSGKSTLAKIISGLLIPTAGSIDYDAHIGLPIPYVMQHEDPFVGETAWEDIVFLLETRGESPACISSIAASVLHDVGLSEHMHTPLSELSGGQRQLVALAGCLAADAPLLLFDEASSMLDNESRQLILALVKALHQSGKTVIWFTHRISEVTEGDRVIVLEHGAIQFDGSTETFFYGEGATSNTTPSPCEQFGFEPPYSIQIARALLSSGVSISPYPLNASQLAEVIASHEH
jgi:energy-coupling factor transport system ATP-binding protein